MYLEQLIAGALLKFKGEIDSVDNIILNNLIKIEIKEEPFKIIDKYFNIEDNKIFFKEGYDFTTILNNGYQIKDVLYNLQGTYIHLFFDNLDLDEFVLRKIEYLNYIKKEELQDKLTKEEYKIAIALLQKGFLMIPWIQDGTIYNDFEALTLSKEGEVYLYIKDNQEQINLFKNELISNGYNPDLLFMYLATKNLDSDFSVLFNVESFRLFGQIYDLDISLKTLKR